METISMCIGDIKENDRLWIEANCTSIAIDTETTGLDSINDRLSLIQIWAENKIFLIKVQKNNGAENVKSLIENSRITKIFHHATFDLKFIFSTLQSEVAKNIVCTKVAAKLLRGIEVKNTLQELISIYFSVRIDKGQRLSNWSRHELTREQIEYATNDVRFLKPLWVKLESELVTANKYDIARSCFNFLPTQAVLENMKIEQIFRY